MGKPGGVTADDIVRDFLNSLGIVVPCSGEGDDIGQILKSFGEPPADSDVDKIVESFLDGKARCDDIRDAETARLLQSLEETPAGHDAPKPDAKNAIVPPPERRPPCEVITRAALSRLRRVSAVMGESSLSLAGAVAAILRVYASIKATQEQFAADEEELSNANSRLVSLADNLTAGLSIAVRADVAAILHKYTDDETKMITLTVSEGSTTLPYDEESETDAWRIDSITVPDGAEYETDAGAVTLTLPAETSVEGYVTVTLTAYRTSGASSETLSYSIPVSTLTVGDRVLVIELALGGFMYSDETETVTLAVKSANGAVDYTDEYTFTVERDSGDDSSDAVWNAAFAANYDGGTSFDLVFSDMNFTVGSRTTKFWVTATATDGDELEEVIEY